MTKKLALMLWLLVFSASICFGNEIRASDVAVALLQMAIMGGITFAIMYIWKR